jgi:RND superfamily putative drug exporter
MFFRSLGRVVRRAWLPLLVVWALLLLASWLVAPSWREVAQDQEFGFLPTDAPSRRAEEVFARAFPDDRPGSNVVLVLHRPDGERGRLDRDLKFIEDDLEPGLRRIAQAEGGLAYEPEPSDEPLFPGEGEPAPQKPRQRSIIARVRTPNAPGTGALLVSPDGQALLVVVELTTEILSRLNWPTIEKVEDLVCELREQGKVPEGLEISLTGSAVLGRDHSVAELQSVRATGFFTILLVVVLLVLIYRAPLLALIPLATVFLAVQLALNFLAILAGSGHTTLFEGLQIYITILAYGAGVDYCLFLTARYKEELDRGAQPSDAVAGAVGGVGGALVASAATVMCGIGMMLFAQFGKFREAGFAIPLSLLLVLCATLTFSPSLLRLAGRWAFWPQSGRSREPSGTGGADGPARLAEPTVSNSWWRFFRAGELTWIWDRVGQLLLRRAGTVWLVTVVLMAPFAVVAGLLYDHLSYDVIGNLPADASSAAGTRLLQEHFPAGIVGPVTVLLVDPHVDFRSDQGRDLVGRLTDRLREREEELGLADIRTLTAPLGITKEAADPFPGLDVPEEARREASRQAALDHYATDLGGRDKIGTRLELLLRQSPFSRQSIEDFDRIEQAVRDAFPAEGRADAQLYLIGTTASVRDLAAVEKQDRGRIELLVLASVFLILVVLLRGFVVPLYLLLSVLFSYYTTLGVAFAVFWLLDPHGFAGIDWKVAIFLFTILIAVGEDYNIFLMTRVREEQQRYGPVRGITEALDRTGPIISSCGIIMAGTFASLLAGSLTEMKQLGFALAFGVLLDTFVVRPILVPAFLILLQGGRLSPAGWAGKGPGAEAPRPGPVARSGDRAPTR